MPYKVVRDTGVCPTSKPFAVKKKTNGKVMGCHPTREKANKQLAALNINESKFTLNKLITALKHPSKPENF
jgi:hypothetical protein